MRAVAERLRLRAAATAERDVWAFDVYNVAVRIGNVTFRERDMAVFAHFDRYFIDFHYRICPSTPGETLLMTRFGAAEHAAG